MDHKSLGHVGFCNLRGAQGEEKDGRRNEHDQARSGGDGARGESVIEKHSRYICGECEGKATEAEVGGEEASAEAVLRVNLEERG